MMDEFEFLLGDWNPDYQFPKSPISDAAGTGIAGSLHQDITRRRSGEMPDFAAE